MMTGSAIVAVIAALGWLVLNFRALQAQRLSFEQKAAFGVAWAVLFAGVTFLFSRLGY
jgi:hypothetical protein